MLTKEQVDEINDKLLKNCGRIFDRPKYRLVFSTAIMEERFVEGVLRHEETGIKIKDVKAITKVLKYPRDQNRYILEMLMEIPPQLKHELVGENGLTYEPLYIFNKNKSYQEPTELAVIYLAYCSHYPIEQVLSPENMLYKLQKKEYEEVMEILDDAVPELAGALRRGSAVFIDSSKQRIH